MSSTQQNSAPTVVDLFSGCGGMSWGLHKAGFSVIAGIDNWARALETFQLNHPEATVFDRDLAELPPEEVMDEIGLERGELSVLVGGPPCQGFSRNVPAAYRFLDDPRNQLFRDYLRFVEAMRPRVVVMENVAEIFNAYGGEVREEIVSTLEALGYRVKVKVLVASDYGVPQRRRRCFFFASRTSQQPWFPEPTHGLTADTHRLIDPIRQFTSAWEAISDLPQVESGDSFAEMAYSKGPTTQFQEWARQGAKVVRDHETKDLKPQQLERYLALEPGQGIKDLPPHLRPKSGYSGAYGRLDFESLAPTITRWVFHPGSGRYGHPSTPRIITMREAARIQSFTDDFRFAGSYNDKAGQIGNAVPPLLMVALADAIKRCCEAPSAED